MSRYLSSRLFGADFRSEAAPTRAEYTVRTAREVGFREDWLQAAIAANPQLVIEPCVEGGLTDEAWWFWAREVSTDAGSIDLLLVSETGRVAIVETKLSYNPEKRRSVLAQVLDYAVSFPELDSSSYPLLPAGAEVALEEVELRVQQGDFLLVVAGDQLDPRAVRLGRALLGDHLVNQWDLALVEVAVYERSVEGPGPSHLLVPHLQGTLERELRQVVRVEVVQSDRNRVVVERTAARATSSNSPRDKWEEGRFFSALDAGSLPQPVKRFAHDLGKLRDDFPGTEFFWGTGMTGSATFKRNGQQLVEFYLDGRLGFRTHRPPAALGADVGEAYVQAVRRLFPQMEGKKITTFEPHDPDQTLPALLQLLRNALTEAASKPS